MDGPHVLVLSCCPAGYSDFFYTFPSEIQETYIYITCMRPGAWIEHVNGMLIKFLSWKIIN